MISVAVLCGTRAPPLAKRGRYVADSNIHACLSRLDLDVDCHGMAAWIVAR